MKPALKKVSTKYDNKFAKLQKKAAEFNFRKNLKTVKKKEFSINEEDSGVYLIFFSDSLKWNNSFAENQAWMDQRRKAKIILLWGSSWIYQRSNLISNHFAMDPILNSNFCFSHRNLLAPQAQKMKNNFEHEKNLCFLYMHVIKSNWYWHSPKKKFLFSFIMKSDDYYWLRKFFKRVTQDHNKKEREEKRL